MFETCSGHVEEINCSETCEGSDCGCEARVCKLFFFLSECISDAHFSYNLETYKSYCHPKDETKEEGPMDVPASPGFLRKQLPFTYS